MAHPGSVEDYLSALPDAVQPLLREVRRRIAEALPGSSETISYAIPTVVLDGRTLIAYGAWKSHLGLYPVPVTEDELEQAVAPYRSTKDTLGFPYRDPIPIDLIVRVVTARAAAQQS